MADKKIVKNNMNPIYKNIVIAVIVFFVLGGVFSLLYAPQEKQNFISVSQLVQDINSEKVKKIEVMVNELLITFSDDKKAVSIKETNAVLPDFLVNLGADKEKLQKTEISVITQKESVWSWLLPILIYGILPLLVIGFFFWTMIKQAKTGAMQTFDFTKARARIFGAEGHDKEKITFKEVAGLKEAKEELVEIVDFLKFPKKYLAMGAKIPRGVLLLGGAGVGKTLLARATAGEANVPFFSISGSEFVEMFVGVGSARVRDLFATAKKASPSIIFIDELDAIGRHRGAGIGGGHDEREQTLNQILVEMDGFDRDSTAIVMGATNRPDVLDPALLRPGRFDRRIIFDLPDMKDREEILNVHAKGKPVDASVSLQKLAQRTPGFSGADLANLLNEAAILAVRRGKKVITESEVLESIEKVLLGPERKNRIISEKEKKMTAYHEAGHAVVGHYMAHCDPVRKVSIISRGQAGGYTLNMPSEDTHYRTLAHFRDDLAMMFGGYAVEKLI